MIIGIESDDYRLSKNKAEYAKSFWKDGNFLLDEVIPVEISYEIAKEKRLEIKQWIEENISYDIYAVKEVRNEKIGMMEEEVPIFNEQEVIKGKSFGPFKLPDKITEEVQIGTEKILVDDMRRNRYWIFQFKNEDDAVLFKLAWA